MTEDDELPPPNPRWVRLWRRLAASGRTIWLRRAALTAFATGTVTGVLLTSLAVYGWPIPADEDLHGDALVVLSGQDDGAGDQRQRLINTWNALHPEKKARIEVLSSSADAQYVEMRRRAQSKRPDVDIFNLDVTWTAEFAAAGYIRPLKAVDESGFLAKPLKTCRYQKTLWALPFNTDAGLLFFRPKRLQAGYPDQGKWEQANPKRHQLSWARITRETDTVLALNRTPEDPLESGYTGQFDDYEGLTVNAMEAIWEAEGSVVDEHENLTLDSEEARDGLRSLASGFDDHLLILPDARQQKESDSIQAFKDGRVLFMRNWPVAYRQIKDTGQDPNPPAAATDFDVTTLPGPSALGGQNLAVAIESRHPEAARELIEFLTDEASQQILFQDGGFASTRLRTYRDRRIQEQYPYADTLLNAVEGAKLRPVTPHYSLFSRVFREVVNEILDRPDHRLTDDQLRRLQRALKGKGTP